MICGHCTHWCREDGQPPCAKAEQLGDCGRFDRLRLYGDAPAIAGCFEREPGADDDQQYAAYLDQNR